MPDKTNLRIALFIPSGLILLTATVAAFYLIQSHDWREWKQPLAGDRVLAQTIVLPARMPLDAGSTAFVLIDLSAGTLAPPLRCSLNDRELSGQLLPLAQFQPNNADILQCLAIQAEGMSLDLRSFRAWWVLPFPSSLLRPGENVISLRCDDAGAKVTVYGDFCRAGEPGRPDGFTYLPSLRSFSYTKGFTTFDHRDPRVFEKVEIRGQTLAQKGDLSDSCGDQFGRYRVRILVPRNSSDSTSPQIKQALSQKTDGSAMGKDNRFGISEVLVDKDHPQRVVGENPSSFLPPKSRIDLPASLPEGTRFLFSCRTRTTGGQRACFVGVTFAGTDAEGKVRSWNSKWQPIGIAATKEFRSTSFSDSIPEEVLSWKNLQMQTLFSPFLPDLLFLKRKEALRSAIEIRDVKFELLPPLNLPPLESREWLIY